MCRQTGQAAVEWVAAILLIAVCSSTAATAVVRMDGWSLGGLLVHRIACTVKTGCRDGNAELRRAYGARDAAFVRRHLPGLVYESGEPEVPVDWRGCRDTACATAREGDVDVHRTTQGRPVTVFTRLVRRSGRRYVQYWFYYPDSNTVFAGSDRIWKQNRLLQLGGLALRGSAEYPGYHRDDWEAASVRVDGTGDVRARVTSHGHWQWCKWAACKGRWGPFAGWTRVSRGSHSGHLPARARRPWGWPLRRPTEFELQRPGTDLHERTTTPDGIRLVPLETIDRRSYRPQDDEIAPPWLKEAYRDPESPDS
jgi:hypothetical protein